MKKLLFTQFHESGVFQTPAIFNNHPGITIQKVSTDRDISRHDIHQRYFEPSRKAGFV
ncbi:hypothetical protein [Gynurincola endophyticus]|uniref:hypothetical protein n=1 Tax=Gynurincola endophyticus TaxID=2479004 RepID=UPI0013159299|nr:hypothetical protein [Gynurincola endophyticus]